jgi:hypothetical protein
MAMIVLSSPATLTGAEEKKTGPARFTHVFLELQNYADACLVLSVLIDFSRLIFVL